MQLDAYGASLPLEEAGAVSRRVEELGFAGIWFTESKRPPFLACAVASDGHVVDRARHCDRSRVPAQPDDHRPDRVGAREGQQGSLLPRPREPGEGPHRAALLDALRASGPEAAGVRACGPRDLACVPGRRAAARSTATSTQFSLLTDFFSPGPSDFPDIPVSIAGVNAGMARLAGEVCDGFHVHPFHSRRYLAEIIRPAIEKGAASTGRDASACEVFCPVFAIVGDTDAEQAPLPRSGPTPAVLLRLDPHVPPGLRAPRLGGRQRAAASPHGEGRHRRDDRGHHRRDARRVRGHHRRGTASRRH